MLCGSRFNRAVLVVLLLALVALGSPRAVAAAPTNAVLVHFDVIDVKGNESVTVRTTDFPVRTKFVVLMDVIGKQGVGGYEAGEMDSGKGGEVEATFQIPEELHGKLILAIRIESKDGYYAHNWFFNRDKGMPPNASKPKAKPEISLSGAKKNASVNIEVKNAPPSTVFSVRVGPFATFYHDYVRLEPVTSGEDGTLKFTLELPKAIQDKNAENLMVRVDGGGVYTYSIYRNVDGGSTVPIYTLYKAIDCKIININPIEQQDPRGDFDVIWTIQNTGTKEWNVKHVVFKFYGGTPMHKYEDTVLFLPDTIKYGGTVEFAVDMRAPETPGWYNTTWALIDRDNNVLCKASVGMSVK